MTAPESQFDEAASTWSFLVPAEAHGARADKVLERMLPALGLRARRRLCAEGRVLLAGRPCGPAVKVHAGLLLLVLPPASAAQPKGEEAATLAKPDAAAAVSCPDAAAAGSNLHVTASSPLSPPFPPDDAPRLVHAAHGLAAVYKPAGLHSVALAGGGGPNLESLLPHLLACLLAKQSANQAIAPDAAPPFPRLLNRLDCQTSGLLLAATDADGEKLWRAAETRGQVDKRYLAVVRGWPEHDFTADRALETDNRVRTRVLPFQGEPLRQTEVHILWTFTGKETPLLLAACGLAEPESRLALLGCRIRKGARHQIRAHLAHAGHPLLADALYTNGGYHGGNKKFFLHHAACALSGFDAACPAYWETFLTSKGQEKARGWLALT